MKPIEFVVERSSWLDALNLHCRYTDFGEVEPSALHPHRRLCITCTNLFYLPCFCSLLVDYFWHCYETSIVSVGGVISTQKVQF